MIDDASLFHKEKPFQVPQGDFGPCSPSLQPVGAVDSA